MTKISSIVVTLLTTASIVLDATSRAHTDAAQIPGTTPDAQGVASLGTTQGVGHKIETGKNVGGGRASIKTVGEGQNTVGDATLGITGSVGQNVGGDKVRVKTAGVGQGAGGGATLGAVDDEIADGDPFYSGSEVLATNGSTPLMEAPWRSANVLFTVKPRGIKPTPCVSQGFANPTTSKKYGCVCNFAGACDKDGDPVLMQESDFDLLEGFTPKGVEAFKYGDTVTICEGGTVGILFDCDGHIPLYAATVIDGKNLNGHMSRTENWKVTLDNKLKRVHVGGKKDYEKSSCMVHCYKDGKSGTFEALFGGTSCTDSKTLPDVTAVDRGHLIAARYGYGHGKNPGVKATFTYTNAVPQMGSFNRGAWNQGENEVMKFAKNCTKSTDLGIVHGKVYVVVGGIPTTFFRISRFFGRSEFSNFQNDKQRILLPLIMWTAACCIYDDGSYGGKGAFYGWNLKSNRDLKYFKSASEMFKDMNTTVWSNMFPEVVVFPAMNQCN